MTDRSVRYNFIGNFSSLSAGLSQANRQVRDFGTNLVALDQRGARMRQGLTQVGAAAGKASLLIGAGLTAATKAAIDWETAWAGVMKTVDASPEGYAKLEAQLREMARTLPATHTEIAAVAEAAGQLGVETPNVAEFTRTMIMLGETTNLTADEAATSMARLANVMGTLPEDVDNVGAALVDLGNNSATTEAEILTLAQRLSAAGSIAGLSEADVLGFAATLSSVGVEAEAGGTALSKVFTTVRDASIDGGEKLETFAKVAGVTTEQFRQAFEDDAAGAIALFVEGLGRINEAGGSTSQVFKDLGLTDQRLARALLSTASAGDLLGDSLARSAEAFEDNSALTEEFAKRLDTTAAQVQISWNNIRDAGIDAGATLLPVVESAAKAVSGLAQAFGDLPAPVQKSITGMAGITAILGGGLWFTSKAVNGVVATKTALRDLGVESPRAARGLRSVGRAAVGLAALAAAGELLDNIRDSAVDAAPPIEKLTGALLDLDSAASAQQLSEDVGDLGAALERLGDPGLNNRVGDTLNNLGSKGGPIGEALAAGTSQMLGLTSQTELAAISSKDAAQALETLDAALANIADQNAPAAEEAFAKLAESQGLSAAQQEALLGYLPQYTEALEGSANASALAAGSTEGLVSPARKAADANKELRKAVNDANKALYDRVSAALAAFDAETAWRQAVKDATTDLKRNEAGIEGSSKKALENREKLSALASAWNNQSDAVKKNEKRQDEAVAAFVRAADQMGVNAEKAERLAKKYLDLPEKVNTDITIDASQAYSAVAEVQRRLDALKSKTITVTQFNEYKGGPKIQQASGGTVPGRRQPYGDRVHALLAPGEEVISNRHGQADRHRGLLKAINAGRYADGGTVGYADGGTVSQILALAAAGRLDKLDRLDYGFKVLEKALKRSAEALDKEREQRDKIRGQMLGLSSAVAGNLRSDLFTTGGGSAFAQSSASGSFADVISTLQGDIGRGRDFRAAVKKLKSKGLSGAALADLLQNGDPTQFADLSRAELAQYQRLYGQRQRVTATAGKDAGRAAFGAQWNATNKEIRELRAEVKNVTKALREEHREDRHSRKKGAGKAGRATARKAG